MARTRQTARKSTGGAAPRSQLASGSARMARQFFSAQQAMGSLNAGSEPAESKRIFVNCENTFASFSFVRPKASESLQPTITLARVVDFTAQEAVSFPAHETVAPLPPAIPSLPAAGAAVEAPTPMETSQATTDAVTETPPAPALLAQTPAADLPVAAPTDAALFMRLDFASSLDGVLSSTTRPPVDIVFAVDVSGSMGSNFPDDTDRRSKLEVAKSCIASVCDQLTPADRVGVVQFNDSPHRVVATLPAEPHHLKSLKAAVHKLRPNGGTELALGLQGGYDALPSGKPAPKSSAKGRKKKSSLGADEARAVDSTDSAPTRASVDDVDAGKETVTRLRRVIFLTDMESSPSDEQHVLDIAKEYALAPASSASGSDAAQPRGGPNPDSEDDDDIVGEEEQEEPPTKRRTRSSIAHAQATTAIVLRQNVFMAPEPIQRKEKKKPRKAPQRAHLTVCGIGVDLSVATVERLSSIPGAKYMSVMNAAEFTDTVTKGFAYDITPLALNIRLTLPPGLFFEKIYGSAELNSVKHASSIEVSAEFPERPDESGCVQGGIYLCQLSTDPSIASAEATAAAAADAPAPCLAVTWTDLHDIQRATSVPILLPGPLAPGQLVSADCDPGLRKAVALTAYVTTLTKYVVDGQAEDEENDSNSDADDDDVGGYSSGGPFGTPAPFGGGLVSQMVQAPVRTSFRMAPRAGRAPMRGSAAPAVPAFGHPVMPLGAPAADVMAPAAAPRKQPQAPLPLTLYQRLHELKAEGLVAIDRVSELPPGTPMSIVKHHRPAALFRRLRAFLLAELGACGDTTLTTINQNVLQTVTQILDLETAEVRKALTRTRHDQPGVAASTAKMDVTNDDVPRSFLCPITLTLMKDPHTAADGHSYERRAIEAWLSSHNTSPVTNLPLTHTELVPNHALRQAIEDFVEAQKKKKEQEKTKDQETGAGDDGADGRASRVRFADV